MDTTFFAFYKVNSACSSLLVQIALANLLVVVEASNHTLAKPIENATQLRSDVAHLTEGGFKDVLKGPKLACEGENGDIASGIQASYPNEDEKGVERGATLCSSKKGCNQHLLILVLATTMCVFRL